MLTFSEQSHNSVNENCLTLTVKVRELNHNIVITVVQHSAAKIFKAYRTNQSNNTHIMLQEDNWSILITRPSA